MTFRLVNHITAGLLFLLVVLIAGCAPSHNEKKNNGIPFVESPVYSYNLYSWKNTTGKWTFTLIKGSAIIPFRSFKEISSPPNKVGDIHTLKLQIEKLPPDNNIEWLDSPYNSVEYPPQQVIDSIVEFAKKRDIQVMIWPAIRE